MTDHVISTGVFPDVAGERGFFWIIARLGDPRTDGHIGIFLCESGQVEQTRELSRIAVPAGSPGFPRIYLHRSELWFAYHDGTMGILRNATTSETIALNPCQNNDPICFGGGFVAWQGAAADGWPITRMSLTDRTRAAAGFGQGTGLSRVLDDGTVILIDADRNVVPGGTRPCWAADLVVVEKHGNAGALGRLETGLEAVLWPERQIVTPRCAYDPSLDLYAVVGWSESDGLVRLAVVTDRDFSEPGTPPDPPIEPEPPVAAPDWTPFFNFLDSRWPSSAKNPEALHQLVGEWHHTQRHTGFGLLAKLSGTNYNGYSEDWILEKLSSGDVFGMDVIAGMGGPNPTVQRGTPTPESNPQNWRVPPVPTGTQPPIPPTPPSGDLAALEARVKVLEDKVAKLEADAQKKVAWKSAHGKYLCGEPDGNVVADRPARGSWEEWTPER